MEILRQSVFTRNERVRKFLKNFKEVPKKLKIQAKEQELIHEISVSVAK
jgi:hypothetical protein